MPGMRTPASVYERSPRRCPRRAPTIAYRDHWATRKVQRDGYIYWHGRLAFVSEVLRGERIGLEPADERYWRVYFGPVWLGVLDGQAARMLTQAQLRRRGDLTPRDRQDRPSAPLQGDPAGR